jgi:hypothetical protein
MLGCRHIHPQIVIAGLDPAIQGSLMNAADFARRLDCRVKAVKPGNDNPLNRVLVPENTT